MINKRTLTSMAAAAMFASTMASAEGVPLTLPNVPPAQPTSPPSYVVPTPELNEGFTVHGADGGYSGSVTHQPHDYGYETNSGTVNTPSGNSYGGSMTTGPNGPVGGSVTFGTTF